jgi:hypothetical protein
VAQHAILNGKLSKSEGASERHPGAYADMTRNGNSSPTSFEFTVHPIGISNEEVIEITLDWKENTHGNLETTAFSLKQGQSDGVSYLTKWN